MDIYIFALMFLCFISSILALSLQENETLINNKEDENNSTKSSVKNPYNSTQEQKEECLCSLPIK